MVKMYYFLSLLTGILISVMIAFNGGLTAEYGIYSAAVIIHIAGLIFISILVLLKREQLFAKKAAWFLYLGGAIGVLTTVFTNMAFGRISVSAILALGLLGQSVIGLLIDQCGLFNMPKHPFSKSKILGLLIIIGGIASMISSFEVLAVIASFIAGINIVICRTLNGKLAALTSALTSTFFNYLIGLGISVLVFAILGQKEIIIANFSFSSNVYIYFGGFLGVFVVGLSNVVVVKISSFYLTLLVFIGQVFSGMIIDIIILGEFSSRIFAGGILVTLGLSVNLILDRKFKEKHNRA